MDIVEKVPHKRFKVVPPHRKSKAAMEYNIGNPQQKINRQYGSLTVLLMHKRPIYSEI